MLSFVSLASRRRSHSESETAEEAKQSAEYFNSLACPACLPAQIHHTASCPHRKSHPNRSSSPSASRAVSASPTRTGHTTTHSSDSPTMTNFPNGSAPSVSVSRPQAPGPLLTSTAPRANNSRHHADELEYFETKEIEWTDLSSNKKTRVNILLQNANGPCPLVSLINTLVLTRSETAKYTANKRHISVKGLLEYLGSLLIDKTINSSTGMSADIENDARLSGDINSVLGLLPKLVTGLNIDPCFDGSFSDSREMALFRLYDVNIVHGWVADPESDLYNYADLKASQSYESSQILIITASEIEAHYKEQLKQREQQEQEQQTISQTQSHATSAAALSRHTTGTSSTNIDIPVASTSSHTNNDEADLSSSPPPPYSLTPDDASLQGSVEASESSSSRRGSTPAPRSVSVSSASNNNNLTPAVSIAPVSRTTTARSSLSGGPAPPPLLTQEQEAMLKRSESINLFLAHYPSQLTEFGIKFLTNILHPGTVAILFRNDHFSTIFRPFYSTLPLTAEGKPPVASPLLTLVTDAGLGRRSEIVWQSLSSISGANDVFLDGSFRVPSLEHRGGAPASPHRVPRRAVAPSHHPQQHQADAADPARQRSNSVSAAELHHHSHGAAHNGGAAVAPVSQYDRSEAAAPHRLDTEHSDFEIARQLQLEEDERLAAQLHEAHGREDREREARQREARERDNRLRETREREARLRDVRLRDVRLREAREREAREREARERFRRTSAATGAGGTAAAAPKDKKGDSACTIM